MTHPTLFISHGAPNTILYDSLTKKNLAKQEKLFDTPKYIIIFSAHWVTKELEIISPEANFLLYDFYGFEQELYEYNYEISSNEEYTNKVFQTLKNKNYKVSINNDRNSFDHGVWTVLSMMKQNLNIPVIQISLPINYSAKELFDLGASLKELQDEALIITSGALTHNLRGAQFNSNSIVPYAKEFNDTMIDVLAKGDMDRLLNVQNIKSFSLNHPTIEHFTPLLIAAGASTTHKATSINSEFQHGNISMESFIFNS